MFCESQGGSGRVRESLGGSRMIRGDPNRYGMVMECAGGSRRVLESAGSMRVRYILDLLDPPYPSRFSWTLPNLISFKTLKALLKFS